jgi:hypothetical protein
MPHRCTPRTLFARHRLSNLDRLAGLNAGERQWRVRWREYRLRHDIFGSEVVVNKTAALHINKTILFRRGRRL